jgi:hypothetical protein
MGIGGIGACALVFGEGTPLPADGIGAGEKPPLGKPLPINVPGTGDIEPA